MGFIAVIGGVFAVGSYMSIRAAQKEIDELRTKYLDMYQESDTPGNKIDPTRPVADKKLPGLTGSKNNHIFGHAVPKCMPWVLFVVWCLLLGVTVFAS